MGGEERREERLWSGCKIINKKEQHKSHVKGVKYTIKDGHDTSFIFFLQYWGLN